MPKDIPAADPHAGRHRRLPMYFSSISSITLSKAIAQRGDICRVKRA